MAMRGRYWVETLGCPKNQVDSEKLAGLLEAQGYEGAASAGTADLVVVNTCAFIEAAREESISTVLELSASKKNDAKVVVTGCMAERYGDELARAFPEVDRVAGFGRPVTFSGLLTRPSGGRGRRTPVAVTALERVPAPSFDLLELPRPPARAPWAYVKVAEGCDRRCGFCAIPSFRGPQRSRSLRSVLDEVESLDVQEVVLVAQDLVSWGRDVSSRRSAQEPKTSSAGAVELLRAVRERVERVRLLYLYPSGLTDELVQAIGASGCPYFDLSLQHVSGTLLRRMRRWGDGDKFLRRIEQIRNLFPEAALRSSFILGYPGETEDDHDALLAFLDAAQLDWVGFFPYSAEEGTLAESLPGQVPTSLALERLRECSERQDAITAQRRAQLVGTKCRVLVDSPGHARSHREAPEIDGAVQVPRELPRGKWAEVLITGAIGPDLVGEPLR